MGRRARKTNDAPITLFSFQDIITCVTGIMLLVTLMLILDLIGRVEREKSATAAERDALRELTTRREALKKRLAAAAAAERNGFVLPPTGRVEYRALLRRERERQEILKNRAETLENDLSVAQRRLPLSREKIATAETRLAGKKVDGALELTSLMEEAVELDTRAAELKAKVQESKKKVRFAIDRADRLNPVLLECSATGLVLREIRKNAAPLTFTDNRNHVGAMISLFVQWLKSRDPGGDYFVLLVKPSAAGYVGDLAAFLTERGFQFGMEPLEEDKTAW